MSKINSPNKIILHCADTPDFEPTDPSFDKFGASDINAWHILRGFKSIGYHWVVRRTGIIEPGRPESEIGAHCIGENEQSIGVCYIGENNPSSQQWFTLNSMVHDFGFRLGLGLSTWHGHREFASYKTCPGFDMQVFRDQIHKLGPTEI